MNHTRFLLLLLISLQFFPGTSFAEKKDLSLISPNEKDSEKTKISKEAAAETLITQTEEKALETLEAILKKSKGKPNEADLWLRRGELYMRRAKSARFFELQRDDVEKAAHFVPHVIKEQKSRNLLVEANKSYLKVFKDFPGFAKADQALYTFSFNLEQLGEAEKATLYYSQLIALYPKSSLVPDSHLALGEIYFHKTDFNKSLEHFNSVTHYKNSKSYWYSEYKKAWVYYNLKNNDQAMSQLILVIKKAPHNTNRISLQEEALKDSTLFFSESKKSEEAYKFYSSLISQDHESDLVSTLLRLSDLYIRHSRYQDAHKVYQDLLKKHKNHEIRSRILAKQSHLYLTEKQFLPASESLDLAIKSCSHLNFKSSDCEIDVTEIQTRLIKAMWSLIKSPSPESETKKEIQKELEKQIRTAQNFSKSTENKYKFTSLLGDYLYEKKHYFESGENYFKAHQIKKSELSLLAAIDSMTLAETEEKKAKTKLIFYIQNYLQEFPDGEKSSDLRLKKIALHLKDKQPSMAQTDLEFLIKKPDLKKDHHILLEDLHFDYLNQTQNYSTLLIQLKKSLENTSDPQRQKDLMTIRDQMTLKVTEDSLEKNTSLLEKKEILSNLGDIATTSVTLDEKNKKAALLRVIKESYHHKLYSITVKYSNLFIQQYPKDPASQDIQKNLLKLAIDMGDLRLALSLSENLLTLSKEKEKSSLIKSILELQQVLGNLDDLKKFTETHLPDLNDQDRLTLFRHFWDKALHSGDTALLEWTEKKVQQNQIEPLHSEIQLFHTEKLITQKKYDESFIKTKKYMSSHYPKEIRSYARLLQAFIFEKELLDIKSKTRLDRLQMVIAVKTERLEKAQKAYSEVIQMAPSSSRIYFEAHLGLERTLGEYTRYLNELEIKNSNPQDLAEIKQALSQMEAPLKKKLESVRQEIAELRQKNQKSKEILLEQNLPLASMESLSETSTFEPIIESSVSQLFPTLLFNEKPVSCDKKSSPEKIAYRSCFITEKNPEILSTLIAESDGHDFKKGELAYLRSFEANKNGRNKEAAYLLNLALLQNPQEMAYSYEYGRHLIHSGQIKTGLDHLYQVYLKGLNIDSLKFVNILEGYLQNNCYKSLAFVGDLKNSPEAQSLLSPLLSDCYAKTGDSKEALKILQSQSKQTLFHHLQFARLYEDYLDKKPLAEHHYTKALTLTTHPGAKVWLTKKLAYLRTYSSSQKAENTDKKGDTKR
jgi:cellulose synthase operon protein C